MRNTHLDMFYSYHESVDDYFCFYCGDIGDCLDHCPPLSLMQLYPSFSKILVKACRECNAKLGARLLPNLSSRLEFLLKKYKKKYRIILKLPVWEKEEIDELSGSLKEYIIAKRDSKRLAKIKLDFIQARLDVAMGEGRDGKTG